MPSPKKADKSGDEEKLKEAEEAELKETKRKEFVVMKYKLMQEAEIIFDMVRKHNEGVDRANGIHFEYSRLLKRDEKPVIFKLRNYTLSKNNPSKRFKNKN